MKLYYFEGTGRAEPIRLLLTHAGVKFEDIRIPFVDWPKIKDTLELKQTPILEEDGKKMSQSNAIMEYLGSKYGYLPKNFSKLYKVMFIMNTAEDLMQKTYMSTGAMSPFDEKAKAEALEKLMKVEGPLMLSAIEKKLKENCTQDFIVGHKYTIADFSLLGLFRGLEVNENWKKNFYECVPTKYPTLWEYCQKRMVDFNPYYKKCKTIRSDMNIF